MGHGFDSHEHVVLNTGRYRAVKFKRLYLNAWEILMAVPYSLTLGEKAQVDITTHFMNQEYNSDLRLQ